MDEHVITIRWINAPDEVGFHDFVEGTYNTFTCTCEAPLLDREAATRHAAECGQCMMCLGAGTISINPHDTGGCGSCDGSGKADPGTVMVQAKVSESFLREMTTLLPGEFGITDVVTLLEEHMPDGTGVETVLSVAAGLIRYLEVQQRIVLCTAPDYLPAQGVKQRYDDPRWIRLR